MIWDFAIWCHQWVMLYVLISEVLMAVNINNVIFPMRPRVVWYMDTRQQVPQKYQHPSLLTEIRTISFGKTVDLFVLVTTPPHSIQSTPSHLTSLTSVSILVTPYKLNLLYELFYSSFPITIIYALFISYNAYYMRWLSIFNFCFATYAIYILRWHWEVIMNCGYVRTLKVCRGRFLGEL